MLSYVFQVSSLETLGNTEKIEVLQRSWSEAAFPFVLFIYSLLYSDI